jgi:pyruvate dehydrogenase E2 component (dihydrolipoamide acetyltransferase)
MATPVGSSALSMRSSLVGSSTPLRSLRGRGVQAKRSAVAPLAAVREIFMPALSSTMTEGKIVSWLKSEGDKVRPSGKGE